MMPGMTVSLKSLVQENTHIDILDFFIVVYKSLFSYVWYVFFFYFLSNVFIAI